MKQTKLDYSAPQAETFVVRFEGAILTGSLKLKAANSSQFEDDEADYIEGSSESWW